MFVRYLLTALSIFFLSLIVVSPANAAGSCTLQQPNPPQYPDRTCIDCNGGYGPPGQGSCGIPDYTETENGVGGCNACVGVQAGTGYWLYSYQNSSATIWLSCGRAISSGSSIGYPNPQDSDVVGCYWGTTLPSACNHGYNTEWCGSGGGSGGGGQCQEESESWPDCPPVYRNRNCSEVPCGIRIDCGCTCTCDSSCEVGGGGQCQDASGGGPSPTPTPTPTPYCTLSCPGGSGTGTGGSGLGTGGGDVGGPTIVPPYASGSISYNGYNGFSCSTFDNGQTGVGACPASGGGGSGGGVGSGGGSESWTQAAKFNMLCGEQPHTYTAEVAGASSGGSGTGSGGTGTGGATNTPAPGTPTPTPTQSLYPQGCTIGTTPTPDPGRSGGTGAGGSGASGGGLSCSCSVTLGCQTSREAPPSDPSQQSGTCNAGVCDFTVDPEMAAFNNELTFTIDHESSLDQNTIDFDDLSSPVSLGTGTSTTHTYVNAGVYDVTLTCSNGSSSIDCTRRVNAYCDNGVAPTIAPTAVPTGLSWFKVKNGTFDRRATLLNSIPSSASSYDSDDDGICALSGPQLYSCMLSGAAGTLRSTGSITLGEGTSSAPAWQKADTTISTRFTPTNYLAYVRARKQVTTITSLSQISTKGIYIYEGNLSMASSDITSTEDFVLVVHGDLTITDTLSSLQNLSAAVITTGTLNISVQASTLYGIFAASTVDFSSDASSTTTPLKIVGNLMTTTSTDTYNERLRSDGNKPSVFVVVDFHRYSDLLDLLSTRYYEQQEIVQ